MKLTKTAQLFVLGFHKRAHERHADLLARGEGDITGETTDCRNRYSLADRQKYGELVPIPCRRGDARITQPEIVHGTTPRAADGAAMVYRHLQGRPRVFRQQRVRDMVTGSGVPQGHNTLQKVSKRKNCNRLPKRVIISSRCSALVNIVYWRCASGAAAKG